LYQPTILYIDLLGQNFEALIDKVHWSLDMSICWISWSVFPPQTFICFCRFPVPCDLLAYILMITKLALCPYPFVIRICRRDFIKMGPNSWGLPSFLLDLFCRHLIRMNRRILPCIYFNHIVIEYNRIFVYNLYT